MLMIPEPEESVWEWVAKQKDGKGWQGRRWGCLLKQLLCFPHPCSVLQEHQHEPKIEGTWQGAGNQLSRSGPLCFPQCQVVLGSPW